MNQLIDEIPLTKDEHGVYRVGGTRVTLDVIVNAFQQGATAEEIAESFSAVRLSDIYQVIGYYLRHRPEIDAYLAARAGEERALLDANPEWSPEGLRARLLARKKQ